MGLIDLLSGKNQTFTGRVTRVSHVKSDNGVAYFGVLLDEETEWLRVLTNDFTLAERVDFLQPDEAVRIVVRIQKDHAYHTLLEVERGENVKG